MVVEPSDDQINDLVAIVACDAHTARRYLRVKNCDLSAATNAIFDNENIDSLESGLTWDDSAFSADREGNANLHPLGASAAPSRRPSPAPAPSLGIQNPKNKLDEDEELARALALSQQDTTAYDFGKQETGTVGPNGTETKTTSFGPATKQEYDMSQWALVTTSAATEIVPDVPIHQRQQGKDEPLWCPRLLKHLPDGDYTPNFITIAHAIPKVREAFLLRVHSSPNYGFDQNWWNGGASITSEGGKIVHLRDGSAVDPDIDKYNEFIEEVQRLTAFLDASARVYASTNALTQTALIKDSDMKTDLPSGSLLELFLKSWVTAAKSKFTPEYHAVVAGLFTTVVGTSDEQGMRSPELTLVDLETDTKEGEAHDLHELLDHLLWDTDPDETEMTDNYIERPADVITIRIQQKNKSNPKSGLRDVPAKLQLDKYLKENVPSTRQLRQQMMQGKRRVAKIEEIEKKLVSWQHPTKSAQIDAKQMLVHTLGHFSGQNRRNADKADRTNNASLENNEPEHYPEVAAQLEKVIASIDDKLEKLAAEKERVRKAISEMSKIPPPGLEGSEPEHHYILRGVATKPNITYVLRHKTAEELQEEKNKREVHMADDDSTTPPGMEWWRLDYTVTGSSAKVIRSKMDDDTVLHAAEAEHNSVLLVYASEDANDSEVVDELPEALRTFIHNDNIQFARDLKKAADEEVVELPPPAYGGWEHVQSSAAMKSIEHDDDQDSTRVNTDNNIDHIGDTYPGSPRGTAYHPISIGLDGSGAGQARASTPVAEIRLESSDDETKDIEMVEKAHKPFVPLPGSDADMGGLESQDMGEGGVGSVHVEEEKSGR